MLQKAYSQRSQVKTSVLGLGDCQKEGKFNAFEGLQLNHSCKASSSLTAHCLLSSAPCTVSLSWETQNCFSREKASFIDKVALALKSSKLSLLQHDNIFCTPLTVPMLKKLSECHQNHQVVRTKEMSLCHLRNNQTNAINFASTAHSILQYSLKFNT